MARTLPRSTQAKKPDVTPPRRGLHWWLVAGTLALSIVGVGIATYLALENLQGNASVCVAVHGCATVQKSAYGKIAGIPVSVPGLALYLVLAVSALGWLTNFRERRPLFTFVAFNGALFGFIFSGYLTYLEGWVLDAWCIFCIISASLLTVIFLSWVYVLRGVSRGDVAT